MDGNAEVRRDARAAQHRSVTAHGGCSAARRIPPRTARRPPAYWRPRISQNGSLAAVTIQAVKKSQTPTMMRELRRQRGAARAVAGAPPSVPRGRHSGQWADARRMQGEAAQPAACMAMRGGRRWVARPASRAAVAGRAPLDAPNDQSLNGGEKRHVAARLQRLRCHRVVHKVNLWEGLGGACQTGRDGGQGSAAWRARGDQVPARERLRPGGRAATAHAHTVPRIMRMRAAM